MKMRFNFVACIVLCLALSVSAFAQGGGAGLGGIVKDQSGALLPGVTITVINTDTNVTTTAITNESGAYNFPSLQPGNKYTVTASLPGFQTKRLNNLELGTATTNRHDFELGVASTATTIDVQAEAISAITATGPSVGDVLPRERIQSLPLVGNNVLDLLDILPGLRLSPLGSESDTIGGLGMNTVNATRDGLSVVDGRYDAQSFGRGTLSTTVLNPDLVGEIRLILSPIDAELGRGNAQVQIQTRSGTNRYTGSAVWNVQNSAFNANSWGNNNDTVGGVWTPTVPDWRNTHQYTVSYGGPIIRNKTFFFALWDQSISNTRDLQEPAVLTTTARQGIFRYWTGFNPGAAGSAPTVTPTTSTNPNAPSVDDLGNPIAPLVNPDGTAYNGRLNCFSVFGSMKFVGGAMVPINAATDCPGGTFVNPPTGQNFWDGKRLTADTTGYMAKILNLMPEPNYFRSGDGLNFAVYRYIRGRRDRKSVV